MDFAKFLVEQGGIWGVMCVALASAVLYKERETQRLRTDQDAERKAWRSQLDQEHAARLADAKENTRAFLEIAERTHEAIDKLGERTQRR